PVVHGLDVVVAIAIVEGTDYRRMRATHDLDDRAFSAPVAATGPELNQHRVAAHGCVHLPRRDVDVALNTIAHRRIARTHKSIAVAMNRKLAGNQILLGGSRGERKAVAFGADKLAAIDQLLQAMLQIASVRAAAQAQLADKLLESGSLIRLPRDARENLAIRCHIGIVRKARVPGFVCTLTHSCIRGNARLLTVAD